MKECKCKDHVGDRLLSLDRFGKNARCSDGLHYSCKDCCAASHKARYKAEGEKVKRRVSSWQSANKSRVNETSQRYRDANEEKRKEITKRWRDKNRELTCHLANKRRAMKNNATPSWFEEDDVKQLYASCPTGSHVHHIVPLQEDPNACGLHYLANLIVLTDEAHIELHKSLERLIETYTSPKAKIRGDQAYLE